MSLQFNTIKIPESSMTQRVVIFLLVLFIFVPFVVGLSTGNHLLVLSLPIGILLIYVLNKLTVGKFVYTNWIEKSTLEFVDEELVFIKEDKIMRYKWSAMDHAEVKISGFEGEMRHNHRVNVLNGTRNYIELSTDGEKRRFNFFIPNKTQKMGLLDHLQYEVSPQIKSGQIHILIRGSNGFKTIRWSEFKTTEYKIYR